MVFPLKKEEVKLTLIFYWLQNDINVKVIDEALYVALFLVSTHGLASHTSSTTARSSFHVLHGHVTRDCALDSTALDLSCLPLFPLCGYLRF